MQLVDESCPLQAPQTDALVIGISAGGLKLLSTILPQVPAHLPFPIFLLEHQKASGKHYLCSILNNLCPLPVLEAEDKMRFKPGHVYVAPAGYHLLIESPHHLALSLDEPVHSCRPSIDVLFESAADVFGSHLIGIILTGMGHDGANGLKAIHQAGGLCAVQNPDTAAYPSMPESALAMVPDAQHIIPESFGDWITQTLSAH